MVRGPRGWLDGQRVAVGIYGSIICASVLAAASEGNNPVPEIAATVLFTLVVFWLAERYSEVLGARMRGEHLDPAEIRRIIRAGWPMVQASYTPLVVLLGAWLLGLNTSDAASLAMGYTVVLLVVLSVIASRRAGLHGWARLGSAGFAAFLGITLILLKAAVH